MDLESSPFNSPVLGLFHLTALSDQVILIWSDLGFKTWFLNLGTALSLRIYFSPLCICEDDETF